MTAALLVSAKASRRRPILHRFVCGHFFAFSPPRAATVEEVAAGEPCQACENLAAFGPVVPRVPAVPYVGPVNVYLIACPELTAAKVGHTRTARVEGFRRDGWRLIQLTEYPTLAEAVAEEERILRLWRDAGYLGGHVPREYMPRGGFTETVPIEALTLVADAAAIEAAMW